MNKLCKAGLISMDSRQDLLVSLLDLSEELKVRGTKNHAPFRKYCKLVDDVDVKINHQFWEKTSFYQC